MASNVSVKITADVVDLQAKFAVARAEASGLTAEFNKLAAQAARGDISSALKSQLTTAAESMLEAQNKAAALRSELSQFQTPIGQSSKSISLLSDSLGALKYAAGALGLSLGAAEIVSFGENALQAASQINHQAQVAGVTAEALQAYRAAVVQAGGSNDDADNLVKRLTKSIGTAQETVGPARQAFVALGLSVEDLQGGAETVLPLISQKLLSIQDVSERARIEFELFGRTGQEIEPALRALSTPTDDLIDKFRQLGLVLDPQLTDAAAASATAQTQAWQRVEDDVVPIVTKLSTGIAWLIDHSVIAIKVAITGASEAEKSIDDIRREANQHDADMAADADADINGPPKAPPAKQWSTPDLDAYVAEQQKAANLAGETARQRQIDSALIEAATDKLKDQGAQESKIVTTATQARAILGSGLSDQLATNAAKAYDGSSKAADAAKRAAREAAEQQLNADQEVASAYAAGTDERIAADQKWLSDAIRLFGQYSSQAKSAQDAVTKDQQAAAEEDEKNAIEVENAQVKAINSAASEQQKALDQTRKYDNLTAAQMIASATAVENARNTSVLNTLGIEQAVAYGNADMTRQVNKQIEDEARQHSQNLVDINRRGLDEEAQDWQNFNSRITGLEGTLVSDVFSQNQSLWQDLRQAGLQFLSEELADDIKYWTERKLLALEGVNAENVAEHGGMIVTLLNLGQKTTATASSQTAQTGAVVAGVAARTTADAAGQAAGLAAQATTGSAAIVNDAYKAAAGTYAALADIPVAGPILAPIGAAAAFTAVMAFDSLTSAEGGDPMVSAGLYQLHNREMVMPARIADPQRDFFSNPAIQSFIANAGSGSGSSSGGSGSFGGMGGNVNIGHIGVLDSTGVKQVLNRAQNKRVFTKFLRERSRAGTSI